MQIKHSKQTDDPPSAITIITFISTEKPAMRTGIDQSEESLEPRKTLSAIG